MVSAFGLADASSQVPLPPFVILNKNKNKIISFHPLSHLEISFKALKRPFTYYTML